MRPVLCGVLVFLILAARVPTCWTTGEFVAEDGWVFFADAWNHPFHTSIFLPYAGYFHVLPRLIAEFCTLLPVAWQPHAYAGVALAINAALLSAFSSAAFRGLVASDRARFGIALLLALAPNIQNLGLLLGLHWYLAFGLGLLLVAPAPHTPAQWGGFFAYTVLTAASSPAALALLPVAAVQLFFAGSPDERRKFAAVTGLLAAVAALIFVMRLTYAERTGTFAGGELVAAAQHLFLRGWIAVSLIGPSLARALASSAPWLLDLFGFAVLAGLGGWVWKTRADPRVRAASLLLGAAGLMLLLSLTRTVYISTLAERAMPLHTRYLTAPTLLLYVALALLATQAWRRHGRIIRMLVAGLAVALVSSFQPADHWAKISEWFHLREAAPAIAAFESDFARTSQPASLYIPSDVPYWGPVLERGGGVAIDPSQGIVAAVAARRRSDGRFESWLGSFEIEPDTAWIDHHDVGRLEFTGVEQGRTFFRDADGRQWFTSPLLYPRWWRLDQGAWKLIVPPS